MFRTAVAVFCIAFMLSAGARAAAAAATYRVDAAAPPGGDGLSWATAFNDLHAALAAAQSGDSVFVARGVYTPTAGTDRTVRFNIPAGVKVYGGFAGFEESPAERPDDPDPESADPAHDTILSGEIGDPGFEDNTQIVVNIGAGGGLGGAVLLDRVAVTRGVRGDVTQFNMGGGVRIFYSAATLRDCLFIDNRDSAVWVEYSPGTVIEGCRFIENTHTSTGGGMLQRSGSVTVRDSLFRGNAASSGGGAVALNFSGTLTIERTRFESNTSALSSGGAIRTSLNSTTVVTDCEFVSNSGPRSPVGANGGAVSNNSGMHTYTRCLFYGNACQSGGATDDQNGAATTYLSCRFEMNESDVAGGATTVFTSAAVFRDCEFIDNISSTGGAVFTTVGCLFERCLFQGNSTRPASNQGGALALSGTPRFVDCDFVANRANVGAAAYVSGGSPTLERCRFFRQTTTASGGVFFTMGSSSTRLINCLASGNTGNLNGSFAFLSGTSTMNIHNCTIVNNAGAPQAIRASSTAALNVWNSIIRNPGPEFVVANLSVSYSNIEGGAAGAGNIDADPLFADPSSGDFSLMPGSPCIDAGDNAAVPVGVETDLAGAPRFRDDPATPDTGAGAAPVVDIGAYEFQPPPACPGDANNDGVVNFPDITAVLSNWGGAGPIGDANNDGQVNFADITSVLVNFGAVCD